MGTSAVLKKPTKIVEILNLMLLILCIMEKVLVRHTGAHQKKTTVNQD